MQSLEKKIFNDRDSKQLFENIMQFWATARMDVPNQLAGRFDDAAKQLITVGGILQVLYSTAFTFSNIKQHIPFWAAILLFLPILSIIFCSARAICILPLKMEAIKTYKLFKAGLQFEISGEALDEAMHEWCESIEILVEKKRFWVHWANLSLLASSVITVIILIGYLYAFQ